MATVTERDNEFLTPLESVNELRDQGVLLGPDQVRRLFDDGVLAGIKTRTGRRLISRATLLKLAKERRTQS
jgi:hypothetical protein